MLSMTDISVRIAGRLLIDHSSVQIVPGASGSQGPGPELQAATTKANEVTLQRMVVLTSRA